MSLRILMTGATGFVGSHLRPALVGLLRDAVVTGVRATDEPVRADAPTEDEAAGTKWVVADLRDGRAIDAVVAACRPDVVIHLAAQSSVAASHAPDGDRTWTVNVEGTDNIAGAVARRAPHATVLFASSAEVYGGSFSETAATETTRLAPLNAYAKSKVAAEQRLADRLTPQTKLIIARPFNHTGPGQREDFVLASFAGQIVCIEAGLQPPVMSVGNLDVARDFLDVRDVVAAYLGLIEAAPRLPPRTVVNVASGQPRKLKDLLRALQTLSGVDVDVRVDPTRLRPVDVPVAFGDSSLLRSLTGWRPCIPIETTLSDLLAAARRTISRETSDLEPTVRSRGQAA